MAAPAQKHFRVRNAACATLAKWQCRHAPRVNVPVAVEQSWHGLATLVAIYKVKCDMRIDAIVTLPNELVVCTDLSLSPGAVLR